MATTQQTQEGAENQRRADQRRDDRLGQRVLHVLGQPDDLQRVQVRPLWEGHYRVNVLVGADAATARVAHSYFLVTDGDDNIVAATPSILKRY